MARNGSGTYVAPSSSWNPAINNTLATSGDWQALLNDIVAALTQSLSRDGQGPMTGNLQMGGNKITGLTAGDGTGQALIYEQLFNQGTEADLASAATTDIGAQLTNFLRITGTTTITSFGTNYKGPRFLRFAGAVLLTNSATLSLPGGANITTAAGDCLIVIPTATLGTADGWRVVAYQKNAVPGTVADGSISTAKLSTDLQNATYGFKNRIINGAMMIDQRNAGASVTPTTANATYSGDRWLNGLSVSSKYSSQQNAGGVTPPVGFTNYIGITSLSAYTCLAADYFNIQHRIEGFNFADFGFGAAGASPVTISFWVRSSLTGSFGGSLGNSNATRQYPFSYTINAANTWEQKTITIAGDTTGTWNKTNGIGAVLYFGLGYGTTYGSGTAGAWVGADNEVPTGSVSVVGTSGATFYITGVQLEKGSTATSFDLRPYGTELALCQRYCFVQSGGGNKRHFVSGNASGTTAFPTTKFPVTMRTGPSLTISSAGHFTFETYTSSQQTCTGISSNVSTPDEMSVTVSVASSLATGGNVIGSNASAQVIFSAEL